jgi:hypothetical protein
MRGRKKRGEKEEKEEKGRWMHGKIHGKENTCIFKWMIAVSLGFLLRIADRGNKVQFATVCPTLLLAAFR